MGVKEEERVRVNCREIFCGMNKNVKPAASLPEFG